MRISQPISEGTILGLSSRVHPWQKATGCHNVGGRDETKPCYERAKAMKPPRLSCALLVARDRSQSDAVWARRSEDPSMGTLTTCRRVPRRQSSHSKKGEWPQRTNATLQDGGGGMKEGGNNRRVNVPSLYGKARPPQPTKRRRAGFQQEWR